MRADQVSLIDRIWQWWWVQLPLRVAHVSGTIGNMLTDGLYLVRWPIAAAVLPPITLIIGLIIGLIYPGPAFSVNPLIIVILLILGMLSAQLGAWTLVGFMIGDFLFHDHDYVRNWNFFQNLLQIRVPLLLTYLLLAIPMILGPVFGTLAKIQVRQLLKIPDFARLVIEVVARVGVYGVLVYVWASSMPMFIRPIFTWRNQSPVRAAIQPFQDGIWILVGVAVVTAIARGIIEIFASSRKIDSLVQVLSLAFPLVNRPSQTTPIRQLIGIVVQAALLTWILGGLIANALEAVAVLIFLVVILWVSARLRETNLPVLVTVINLPVIVRLIAALLVSYFLSQFILQSLWLKTQGFQPILVPVCIAIGIISLLTVAKRSAEVSFSVLN